MVKFPPATSALQPGPNVLASAVSRQKFSEFLRYLQLLNSRNSIGVHSDTLHKELDGLRAVIGKFQAIIGNCFHKCFTEENCFENRTKQRRRQNWQHPCGTISGYKCLHGCTLANGFVYLGQVSPKKLVADTWAATRDEEHAVSMDSDGPFSPSVKLMRPHTTLHRHHNKHPGQPTCISASVISSTIVLLLRCLLTVVFFVDQLRSCNVT